MGFGGIPPLDLRIPPQPQVFMGVLPPPKYARFSVTETTKELFFIPNHGVTTRGTNILQKKMKVLKELNDNNN